MTLAGPAVAVFAAALLITGLTGGCDTTTDTRHYDDAPAPVAPPPQPVLEVGDTMVWVHR